LTISVRVMRVSAILRLLSAEQDSDALKFICVRLCALLCSDREVALRRSRLLVRNHAVRVFMHFSPNIDLLYVLSSGEWHERGSAGNIVSVGWVFAPTLHAAFLQKFYTAHLDQ
jgi:hypothetical protein